MQNRRGAILVLTALSIVTLLTAMAVALDVSRLFLQRSELQTATDAAAHAGAIQLVAGDRTQVANQAVLAGNRNVVIGRAAKIVAANVTCGTWTDGNPGTFTAIGSCDDAFANAVRVIGTDPSRYMFGSILNAAGVTVTTSAIAWDANTVDSTKWVRPFGMLYSTLTDQLGKSDPNADLTDADWAKLASIPLQMTAQSGGGSLGPGNYGLLLLEGNKLLDSWVTDGYPGTIGPGDSFYTKPGSANQISNPLCELCNQCSGNGKSSFLPCWSSVTPAKLGVVVPVPLLENGANGKKLVTVRMVTAFSIDSITNKGDIKGHFVRAVDEGAIGTKIGGLTRVVLVR